MSSSSSSSSSADVAANRANAPAQQPAAPSKPFQLPPSATKKPVDAAGAGAKPGFAGTAARVGAGVQQASRQAASLQAKAVHTARTQQGVVTQHQKRTQELQNYRHESVDAQAERFLGRVTEMLDRERMPLTPPRGAPRDESTASLAGSHERGVRSDEATGDSGKADVGAIGGSGARNSNAAPVEPPTSKAREFAALVKGIELWTKTNHPTLNLHVGGGLNGEVRVERTGHNEVAMQLRTTDGGATDPRAIQELRRELGARGLTLSRWSVNAD